MQKKVSIILPAFNEEATIAATITGFSRHMPEAEIVVINNSSDHTRDIAERTIQQHGIKGFVLDEPRPGKGNAMRRAFAEVDADVYVMADADLTYPPQRVHDLVAPIESGFADMVVGDRHSEGHYARENDRLLHGFGNRLVQRLVNLLFRTNLVDIMSGYRAMSRKFVKNYPVLVEGFQIETDMTLHALHNRFRIVEIPVEYQDRPEGSVSKLNTVRDGARVLFAIMQILRYYRPMVFFGLCAAVFGILGLVSAVPVAQDWVEHRYIYHVPLAILATGLEITALTLLGTGLILDTIVHFQRLQFERSILNLDSHGNRS